MFEAKTIGEFKEGEVIQNFFLIKNVEKKIAANKTEFLDFTLGDKTGEISAKKWNATEDLKKVFFPPKPNQIIKVQGKVDNYKGNMQLIIEKVRLATESDEVSIKNFVPTAPYPSEEMFNRILEFIQKIDHEEIRNLTLTVWERNKERLLSYPAAQKNHHAVYGGLLYHKQTMLQVAEALLPIYPFVNKNYLYAGIALHDIAKIFEMEAELGIVSDYSTEGKLLGHITQGITMIDRIGVELGINEEVLDVLKHMILSHHGKSEWGSPKSPMTAEADLLHLIDNIDAHMYTFRHTLEGMEKGTFSDKIFSLGNIQIYKCE